VSRRPPSRRSPRRVSSSPSALKWRRAVAAACALSLFSTAVGWFTGSDEGLGAAIVFGSPALLVGSLAAWWAWRGYAVRPTPPLVVAVLWAMAGGALTFTLVFTAVLLIDGTDNNLAGLPAILAAPVGAVMAAVVGFLRQRAHVRSRAPFSG
jgi:hypothetical protein